MYVKNTLGFYHFKQLSIMIFNFYMGAIVYVSALTCVCLNVCARTISKQKGFRFTFVQLEKFSVSSQHEDSLHGTAGVLHAAK